MLKERLLLCFVFCDNLALDIIPHESMEPKIAQLHYNIAKLSMSSSRFIYFAALYFAQRSLGPLFNSSLHAGNLQSISQSKTILHFEQDFLR